MSFLLALGGCAGAPDPGPAPAPAAPATGASEPGPVADWCGGHGVPESVCTRCNPALIPDFQARGDWCAEHGLPESQCTICNPELIEKFRQMAPGASTGAPHPPGDGAGAGSGQTVRLATPETAAKVGIRTEAARETSLAGFVEAPARLGFDETRSAGVASPVLGTVREVLVVPGSRVSAGDPLIALASPELSEAGARLAEAEAALVLARETWQREARLVERHISARRDLLEAERSLRAAEASRASARGVLDALGAGRREGPGASGRLVLRAPRAGTLTRLEATLGQAVTAGQLLAQIEDPATLWAHLDIPEAEVAEVREGAAVRLRFPALPEREAPGEVAWIAPDVDARTRTVRGRAVVANPEGWLRAGMYGEARIALDERRALMVPGDAIQSGPEGPVAFVQVDAQLYEPRMLRLGRASGREVEVLAGLRAGDRVVTRGSFQLATEIRKEGLGAGCCDAVER